MLFKIAASILLILNLLQFFSFIFLYNYSYAYNQGSTDCLSTVEKVKSLGVETPDKLNCLDPIFTDFSSFFQANNWQILFNLDNSQSQNSTCQTKTQTKADQILSENQQMQTEIGELIKFLHDLGQVENSYLDQTQLPQNNIVEQNIKLREYKQSLTEVKQEAFNQVKNNLNEFYSKINNLNQIEKIGPFLDFYHQFSLKSDENKVRNQSQLLQKIEEIDQLLNDL